MTALISKVKEGFSNQINLCRDRGLNPGPPAPMSGTLPLDHQVTVIILTYPNYHWLDPAKTLMKQVKDIDPVLFSFRVKFYPPDPFRLKEEITRYQIYLQLKRDLLHGRLYCTPTEAALLAAYIIQVESKLHLRRDPPKGFPVTLFPGSEPPNNATTDTHRDRNLFTGHGLKSTSAIPAELGDYDPEEHEENYVSDFKLLLKQTQEIEEKIMEIHRTHLKGQTPAQTENNFLKKACQLDTYGVDPHPVKDHRGNQLYLGINHCGILTFQGSRKTHHFHWPEVQKINYEGKMFIVHLTYIEVVLQPSLAMYASRLPSSSEAPTVVTGGSFFSWGTKFRYTGRVEREILEDVGPLRKEEPAINRNARTGSLRRKASSVPATPSTPVGSDLGYSSLPRSNHSGPLSDSRLDGSSSLLCGGDVPMSSPYCPDNTLPLLETVCEDQEIPGKLRSQAEEIQAFINHEASDVLQRNYADAKVKLGPNSYVVQADVLMRAEPLDVETTKPKVHSLIGTAGHLSNGGGGKESEGGHGFDDYYFRDSFDHSSSESQLVELGGGLKPSSMVPVPLRTTPVGRTPSKQLSAIPAPAPTNTQQGGASAQRRFNLLQVFVPSFVFVALSLAVATVLVLESDCDVLSAVRSLPEMVVLRREYYEPVKEYLRQRISKLLS
uniref:Moesin/ezrin/radixin homolog 1 n=1 Tax=Timema cristinae TaxID=61476 RepID=A0A7R9CFX1_TIMCR|nr:unnamed protein product [Timema cristinae]